MQHLQLLLVKTDKVLAPEAAGDVAHTSSEQCSTNKDQLQVTKSSIQSVVNEVVGPARRTLRTKRTPSDGLVVETKEPIADGVSSTPTTPTDQNTTSSRTTSKRVISSKQLIKQRRGASPTDGKECNSDKSAKGSQCKRALSPNARAANEQKKPKVSRQSFEVDRNSNANLTVGTVSVDRQGHHVYTCQDNDTPLEIAMRFNMCVGELLDKNRAWYLPKLKSSDLMKEGTQLWVSKQRSLVPRPKTEWQVGGNQYIGAQVRKQFGKRTVGARVVGYLRPGNGADELALWHVVHDDGDEEDLDLQELQDGLALHAFSRKRKVS